jgi:hypothetical protein
MLEGVSTRTPTRGSILDHIMVLEGFFKQRQHNGEGFLEELVQEGILPAAAQAIDVPFDANRLTVGRDRKDGWNPGKRGAELVGVTAIWARSIQSSRELAVLGPWCSHRWRKRSDLSRVRVCAASLEEGFQSENEEMHTK